MVSSQGLYPHCFLMLLFFFPGLYRLFLGCFGCLWLSAVCTPALMKLFSWSVCMMCRNRVWFSIFLQVFITLLWHESVQTLFLFKAKVIIIPWLCCDFQRFGFSDWRRGGFLMRRCVTMQTWKNLHRCRDGAESAGCRKSESLYCTELWVNIRLI